jgi:oligosaccharide repeat unit polymerase
MFIIFYLFLFSLIILFSIKIEKKLINPLSIFGLGYCILPILSLLNENYLQLFNISSHTHYLILLSIFSFFCSYIISSLVLAKHKIRGKKYLNNNKKEEYINFNLIIFLNLISWLIVFPIFLKALEILRFKGFNFLRDYATEGYLFNSTQKEIIYNWIIFPIFIASGIYSSLLIKDWKYKRVKLLIFISTISLLLHTFIYAARALLVRYIFYFVVALILFNYKKIRNKKRILILALLFIIIFVLISYYLTRERSQELNVYSNIILYYTGPFYLLEAYLTNPVFSRLNDRLNGKITFGFIYNLFEAAKYIIFKSPYEGSDSEITNVTAIPVPVGYGIKMNAGCTAVYAFLRDFGIFGIILGFSLIAVASNLIKYMYETRGQLINKAMYLMFLYNVFRLASSYREFYSPELFFCILYIILFSTYPLKRLKVIRTF